MLVNLPNMITIARLVMVPVAVWLIADGYMAAAFCVFVAAGVSDAVDGFIAKRFDMRTELGTYLDPIADKALLVSIYVTLTVKAEIPLWLTILVVSRDLLIVGAFLLSWILDSPLEARPLMISKGNTFAQILFVILVLADLAFGLGLEVLRIALIYLVAALTVGSAAAYLVGWLRHMAQIGSEDGAK